MSAPNSVARPSGEIPCGDAAGFFKYFKYDALSGFLVFLIALPLCLAISLASGYPAIAGIFTASVGAIITTFISNSELTIKGPAAGMIVIVVGCVEAFGGDGFANGALPVDMAAYRMALAVTVVAAALQIVFGLLRLGILGEFFPLSTVHGMLAAIGIIIITKQIPVALGVVGAKGEPLEMLRQIPQYFQHMNPAVAVIGAIGVLIMFTWPLVQKSVPALKMVPAALIVLAVTVPIGGYLNLLDSHKYTYQQQEFELGPQYLVKMPEHMFGMFQEVTRPEFSVLISPQYATKAWGWVLMFFMIGTLESLLSAKAVDLLDPWKRKTNMNRDITAVGIANLCAAMIGGLPMISEIVRSRANIDNGARTRFADLWHGLCLLTCVALIPTLLHRIPLAALASMLIFTGFRLAHPREFLHVVQIGKEQLVIFVTTIIAVLATDLLIGVLIGMGVKAAIHVLNGVPIKSLFLPMMDVMVLDEQHARVDARDSAVFSNWLLFRRQLVRLGMMERKNVTLDLSGTKYVDHSFMEKMHELQDEFQEMGLELSIVGLDSHRSVSDHPFAARKRVPAETK